MNDSGSRAAQARQLACPHRSPDAANELPDTTFTARLSRMGAEVVQLKPTPHPDWVINPDDFPSDCDTARTLGVWMTWHGPGVIIKPLTFSSSACDLIVYSRRGLAAWRVAALTGLPQALVDAFNEGFNEGRGMDAGRVTLLTGRGGPLVRSFSRVMAV
jgi:hypothetical protein